MVDLLTTYSLSDIFVMIVVLAVAIKAVVTFWDWAYGKLKTFFESKFKKENKENLLDDRISADESKIDKLFACQEKTAEMIEKNNSMIQLLIESDKDDIKSWITEKHHYFCYEVKHIDDYSLDCIEKRYKHYEDEGGNSFVKILMEDIRQLPKVSNIQK